MSKLSLMLIDPGENESSQKHSKKSLNRPFTNTPEEVGIDAPALVQKFLEETYGVEYSYSSCRRLLKEAKLSYQKPRRTAAEGDESDTEKFRDDLKKASRDGRHSSLHRSDQEIRPG